jgi:hypothetical protein
MALIPQFSQSLQRFVQGNKRAHLLGSWIVTIAEVDGSGFLFFGADDYIA